MKYKLHLPAILLSCGMLLFSNPDVFGQGKGHGNGKYKHENGQGNSGKAAKGKYKNTAGSFPHITPHTFKVPPGHYPPAGTYRIWYPGRPPGHQPSPVAYGYPPNAPITDGAFIIHGNKAYDTQYDWRKEEAKKPKSVPREIIDILFPKNTLPVNN